MKDVSINGFAGISNKLTAERIQGIPAKDAPLVDLAEAVNVDIDNSGKVWRRSGQTLQSAGAAHSLWSEDRIGICLYVRDGMMYRLNEDMTSTALAAGLGDERI